MGHKRMKCLITGGAGFIGSHLCDYLIREDHSIVVIDNLSLGKKENIQHLMSNKNFKFYMQDILQYDKMSKIFSEEKFDIVFHLAANSDIAKSRLNPNIDFNNTFMTTYNILNLMKEFEVKKIVFASTSAIYGETKSVIDENYGPLFPVSLYGASKLSSEGFITAFGENYGIKAWIVRFPNVIGERATHGVILDFIKKLKANPKELIVLGDGEQNKPYLYVKDLIEAIIHVWQHSADKINYYNIGVDTRTKVKDIANMTIKEMGLNAEIKYTGGDRGWIGDVPEFKYDLTKIHALGWKAKVTSDEAVLKSIKYILKEQSQK
ncbi:MAG: NAD-dependent epimerase/dehydratase family protein [Candidatus Woesearchaeota archaeon]